MLRRFNLLVLTVLILGAVSVSRAETPSVGEATNHIQGWAQAQRISILSSEQGESHNYVIPLKGWLSDRDAMLVYQELFRFTSDPKFDEAYLDRRAAVSDPLHLPHSFVIHEKFFAFPTAQFEIKKSRKDRANLGSIEEKFFSLTRAFTVYDAAHVKVGSARQKFFSWGVEIEVFDGQDRKLGTIKEHVWKSFFKVTTEYSILDSQGAQVALSKKVDWIGTQFDVLTNNELLIHMERPWIQWSLTDNWSVDLVNKRKVDPLLLLMSAVYKTSVDNERRAVAAAAAASSSSRSNSK